MLAPRIVNLNDIVTENLKMLTRMIGEDIDLVMVPAPNLWPVRADPGQIEQVIMNLAVNARDAMPTAESSPSRLRTSPSMKTTPAFTRRLRPGDYVMIAISDTGVGMDTDTQSHIFEPFFTTKGPKGTGLGLSTVYGIIKQSGGYIWVYSEVGTRDDLQDLSAARRRRRANPRRSRRRRPAQKWSRAQKPSCWSKMKPTCVTLPANIWRSRATR